MRRPWMPLYIADYLKDTTHLGALESGAYLHLIMDYWQNGRLPDDDRLLARIAKLTDREWKRSKPVLQAFFQDGWKHKRIDAELAHTAEVSSKRRDAANARHHAKLEQKTSKADANAHANGHTLHTSHFTEERKDAAGAAPEAEVFRRGKEVLGPSSGGMIKKLITAKQGNLPLSRAAIEQASTKENPREYVARIIKGHSETPERPDRSW